MAEFRGGGGGWTGFGEYMRDKTLKLAGQFDIRFAKKSDIFLGKTFWSTGRIEGIEFDIKQAITENGGTYEQYGLRNVSHIIASNVALSNQNWKKLLGGRFARKSYCLVTPQWLEDSIKAGKALPESEYLTECLRADGTLESLFGEGAPRVGHENSGSLDSYDVHDGKTVSLKKLVRVDIDRPSNSVAVVEEFCFEFLGSPFPLGRRGYVSVTHMGSVNVFSLDFPSRTTCLSEALMNELGQREWAGVSRVSLALQIADRAGSILDVFPTENELPATASSSRLLSFIKSLSQSNEDNIHDVIRSVSLEAGASLDAVILDAVYSLLRNRRLDVVRDIARSLVKYGQLISDLDTIRWAHQLTDKVQRAFQWENQGAKLMI